MKQAILVILLIAAGAWLADMHVAAQTYHPVIKVAAPEGLTYTVVQEPTGDRGACGAANDRFLGPFKTLCKKCQVLYARCARELEGVELSMQDGKPIPAPLVHAQGLRIAVEGPAAAAKSACEFIVGDLVSRGVPTAACIYPKPG